MPTATQVGQILAQHVLALVQSALLGNPLPAPQSLFATRVDLLQRCNAVRLAQLAVPTDRSMIDDTALRTAIEGGDLSAYSPKDVETIVLALDAIDKALADADALLMSYNIPSDVQTPLLTRLASTVAIYYLQSFEGESKSTTDAYNDVIKQLTLHAAGKISLIPPIVPETTADSESGAQIFSNPGRYD